MMPEMDGFEFLDEMRKKLEWADIPVVVLTAKELTPDDRARLSGHVEKVIQKGAMGRDDILKEVRRLVATCARRSAAAVASPGGEASAARSETAGTQDAERTDGDHHGTNSDR